MPYSLIQFLLKYIKGNNSTISDIASHFDSVVEQVQALGKKPGCEDDANKMLSSLSKMQGDLENLAVRHKSIADVVLQK